MSTDISAIFGHRESFPPTESVANAMCQGLGGQWDLLRAHDPGCGLVYVRGKFGIYFGPHAAIIGTGERWPRPSEPPDSKEPIISAVCAVARYFRSPGVIFFPGDIEPWIYANKWVGDGLSFDQLCQHMTTLKPPSPTFHDAIRQITNRYGDCYEVDGYVIKELAEDVT